MLFSTREKWRAKHDNSFFLKRISICSGVFDHKTRLGPFLNSAKVIKQIPLKAFLRRSL